MTQQIYRSLKRADPKLSLAGLASRLKPTLINLLNQPNTLIPQLYPVGSRVISRSVNRDELVNKILTGGHPIYAADTYSVQVHEDYLDEQELFYLSS